MQREIKQFKTMMRYYADMNPASFSYCVNQKKISFSDYLVNKSPALPNVNHKVISKNTSNYWEESMGNSATLPEA